MSGFFSLAGKVAVVTGGSSGIGAAIAARFRTAEAIVVIADRRPPPDEDGDFVRVDVSSEDEVSSALDAVVAKHGKLDLLVNNAGIQPLGVRFDGLTASVLERTFAVNVNGTAWGIKHASRLMSPGGRIVNLSSFVTGVILPVDGGIAAGWERYDLILPSEISPDGTWHDPEP